MTAPVLVRCPQCGAQGVMDPRYGEIVTVLCLCATSDPRGGHHPVRMEIFQVSCAPDGAEERGETQ
jgi:phosphoenolpyruvate synthase/pyruvate phosphate dikinase